MTTEKAGGDGPSPRPHEPCARLATNDDLEELAAMHIEASEAVSEMPKGVPLVEDLTRGSTREAVESSFRAQLEDTRSALLLGCLGDVGVGFASLVPDGTRGRITELWVAPDARQVGVGTALLNALRVEASSRDMSGLDSVALPGDRNTKNFFEDHSMVARAIVVGTSEL